MNRVDIILMSTPFNLDKDYARNPANLRVAFPTTVEEAEGVKRSHIFMDCFHNYCGVFIECTTIEDFPAESWRIIKTMLNLFKEDLSAQKAIKHILILEGLNRFVHAHENGAVDGVTFQQALQEIKDGGKKSHWIWYILPQLKNSYTHSKNSEFYAIQSRDEAIAYIQHPLLRQHLFEMAQAMLDSDKTLGELFGEDAIKVRSCFRLFNSVTDSALLRQVVNKFYLY